MDGMVDGSTVLNKSTSGMECCDRISKMLLVEGAEEVGKGFLGTGGGFFVIFLISYG